MPPVKAPVVLQVLPELVTGGVERTAVDVARAIVGAGGTALVASAGGPLVTDLNAAGAEHYDLALTSKNPITIWRNAARLQTIIRQRDVQIVHARSRAPAWSALLAARRESVPFVTTYHGTYKQKSRLKALYNSVMARGDRVIANSHFIGDLIAERHPFARDRIIVIHRGSDLADLAPENVGRARKTAMSDAWHLETGRPVILQVARLTGWKGQRVVIEAMAELKRRGHTAPLAVLAGDAQGRASYLAELNRLIAEHGLETQVRLVGHCNDVAAALALADVAVIASTEPEAFGRAAVEAQAAEVPVIVSDHGAVPETVLAPPDVPEMERTGWRVPPGDARALADTIERVMTLSHVGRATLLSRARAHATRHFSIQAMTGATLKVYAELLESRT